MASASWLWQETCLDKRVPASPLTQLKYGIWQRKKTLKKKGTVWYIKYQTVKQPLENIGRRVFKFILFCGD